MFENIMGALGETSYRSQGRGVNSKVELKIKLLEISQEIGMDYDILLDKFKDEYDALPMSSDDSLRNMVEEVLPIFGDMIERFKTIDADSDNKE